MTAESPPYSIEYARPAAKSLGRLEKETARRTRDAIDKLAADPHPHGLIKLAGPDELCRIRVGDYRVIYAVIDERVVVLILRIAHRREVYQSP